MTMMASRLDMKQMVASKAVKTNSLDLCSWQHNESMNDELKSFSDSTN